VARLRRSRAVRWSQSRKWRRWRAPLVIGMAAARSLAENRPVRIDEIHS